MAIADPRREAPVIVVAAERREFSGLLRHASQAEPVRLPIEFAGRVEVGGSPWLLVANGPGPRLAREAAECAIRLGRPRALVSTGFCGALNPSLSAAEVFVATRIVADPTESIQVPAPLRVARPYRQGPLISQDRVACSVEEKQTLWSEGIHAVEMEAAAVAQVAAENDLPFYCIRVVSDEAATPFPLDFNEYRDDDGRFDRGRIARAAALRPWVWGPLLSFDKQCRHASNVLGDFLADCRF